MLNHSEDELRDFAKSVIRNAKRNLKRKKSNTRNLEGSLDYDLKVHKNSFSLSFYMLPYGEFVDQGVSGKKKKYNTPFSFKSKMPPSKPIDKWIRQRGIKGRGKDGRFITNKSLSFLIRRSIFNNGIKPSLFFTRPFENAFKKLPNELIEQFGLDVDNFIDETLSN